MILEELVPELETCQRLKELGWKEETVFVHWAGVVVFANSNKIHKGEIHAPTAEELAKVLPIKIDGFFFGLSQYSNYWSAHYQDLDGFLKESDHAKMTEAFALLIIWLCENKHLKL